MSARRSGRPLAIATALLFFGALGALVMAVSNTPAPAEHERFSRALRRMAALDARLDGEVANARLGVTAHYDGLVRIDDEIRVNDGELEFIPQHIRGSDRTALVALTVAYRRALEEKRTFVEQFKTDQAVLRNSIRALPHDVEQLTSTLPAEELAFENGLVSLLERVLVVVVSPSEARRAAAACALDALSAQPTTANTCGGSAIAIPPLFAEETEGIRHHAQTILARHAAIDHTIAELTSIPVVTRANQLRATYARVHADGIAQARTRWLSAIALAVGFMLLGAALIITRQRAAAEALEASTRQLGVALEELEVERAREADLAELKSRFVSMTSHEFRTPLSVILSSTELLEAYGQKWDEEKWRVHLARIRESSQEMARMLDDVLLIGRAEAGMVELKVAPVDLTLLAEGVVAEVRAAAGDERSIELVPSGDDAPANLDEKLMRHVLTNLLSNALKYSAQGSTVRFEVRREADGAVFEVDDEGIGIPEEDHARLFEAFHRCSNAESIPGTGLGLAVVKKSLDVHRGTIEVESEVGRGTRFTVRVPITSEAVA